MVNSGNDFIKSSYEPENFASVLTIERNLSKTRTRALLPRCRLPLSWPCSSGQGCRCSL